jgi:hypothetical protein
MSVATSRYEVNKDRFLYAIRLDDCRIMYRTAVFDESDIGYSKADEEKTRSAVAVCNVFVQYPCHAPACCLRKLHFRMTSFSQEWNKYEMHLQKYLRKKLL